MVRARENPKIEKFLDEIAVVCEKHGFSIGHEDSQGGFTIEMYQKSNIDWLNDALDWTDVK